MRHINWCIQLNLAFDDAMMQELYDGHHGGEGCLWEDGLHRLYCMGGEL